MKIYDDQNDGPAEEATATARATHNNNNKNEKITT